MYSSARTKKVATYGRRVQRFVPVSEEGASYRESIAGSQSETKRGSRDDSIYDSPLRSVPKLSQKVVEKQKSSSSGKQASSLHGSKMLRMTPTRKPLAVCLTNIPGSPAQIPKRVSKGISSLGKGMSPAQRLQPRSPVVDVDIIVLDDKGRRVSQERRVTKTNIRVNDVGVDLHTNIRKTPGRAAKRTTQRVIAKAVASDLEDDDDDDDEYIPAPKAARTKAKPRTRKVPFKVSRKLVEREEDSEPDPVPKRPLKTRDVKRAIITSESETSFESPEDLPPSSTSATRVPTLKSDSGCRTNPILIDISAPPTKSTGRLTVEASNPPRKPTATPCSVHPREHDRGSSPGGLLSFGEAQRPHQATPTRPARSRPPFMQQRKPSPIQRPQILDDEYETSFSLSIDPELELALKVAELEISSSPLSNNILGEISGVDVQPVGPSEPNIPPAPKHTHAYLRPLLAECGQIMPFDFTMFIETLPFNLPAFSEVPGHDNATSDSILRFQKIGEASYSEVFGIGNIVLKVIPLTNEDRVELFSEDSDIPLTSDAKDVLKEILVTKTMGGICKGFIKLLRAHVVQGAYPSQLLDLWDDYNDVKGSESVRPDAFNSSQTYAIIVLPNGGPDLETFAMNSTSKGVNWRQACSIFWQVAQALAHAEDLVHFEHRDLHWGQILVRQTKRQLWSKILEDISLLPLDDPVHGVEATIIDLGLSRIGQGTIDTFWTPFTEDIFESEGDYQYDIYRMMRCHNKDDWETFNPLSNVMWLHYLAEKLVNSKHLKPPTTTTARTARTRKVQPSASKLAQIEADKRSYDCLVEVEKMLGLKVASIARVVGAKSRKRTKSTKHPSVESLDAFSTLRSAIDVCNFGKEMQWIL